MSAPWVAAFVALWALVVIVALLLLGTLRRLTPILANVESTLAKLGTTPRLSGLDLGDRVPEFTAITDDGEVLTDDVIAGSPTVMLFIDASCPACDAIIADLEAGQPGTIDARLIVIGEHIGDDRPLSLGSEITVVREGAHALASAFASERTPEAFIIVGGRVVAKGLAGDLDHLRGLVARAESAART